MSSSDRHRKPIISPSMLSADFARLGAEGKRMKELGADWLHVDVMDGHFVPNLTLGAPVVRALAAHLKQCGAAIFLDCHLMVSRPEQWVDDFAAAGASGFTFHIEATTDAAALIAQIRNKGMRVGVALKPNTPADSVKDIIALVDLVLVMTVEPGFGGQAFMPAPLEKVRQLRKLRPDVDIEVDGGVAPDTIEQCAEAGANVIVAGSAIFKSPDPAGVIYELRNAVEKAIKAGK